MSCCFLPYSLLLRSKKVATALDTWLKFKYCGAKIAECMGGFPFPFLFARREMERERLEEGGEGSDFDPEEGFPKARGNTRSSTSFSQNLYDSFLCLKPADRWTLAYLIATLPLVFQAEDLGSILWFGILLRLFVIPVVFKLRQFGAQHKCATEIYVGSSFLAKPIAVPIGLLYWCLDGYILLMFIYLYSEAGQLIVNLHGTVRYDDELKKREQEFFFGQPARDLREWLPSRLLGEYLHFCYFTFYALIGGVVFFIYYWRPREYFDRAASALTLAFYTCFSIYLFYPVEGPYWTLPRPEPEQVSLFFGQVVQWVLKGSSKGTAMPSSHCCISMVCWISAWVYQVRLAVVFSFIVPGLIFATVWCGFHYGLDSAVGTLWGLFCSIVGILLAKHMPYHRPRHDKGYHQGIDGTSFHKSSQGKSNFGKWI